MNRNLSTPRQTSSSGPPEPYFREPPPYTLALFLFIAALIPRLPGLSRFLTSDEQTNIFIAGSDVIAAFLQGDFRQTYWHFYPGVTMSWLDALGMLGQYGFDWLRGLALPPFVDYIYSDILILVVANRLPYALLTAAAVAVTYLLARKLLPPSVALLGALFMAFDPFYLAHSRVAHGDAPLAVFMSLSALCFFIFAQERSAGPGFSSAYKNGFWGERPPYLSKKNLANPYLMASAIFGSLAALTKAPGQFMALFIMGLSFLFALLQIGSLRSTSLVPRPTPGTLRTTLDALLPWLTVILTWGLIALLTFILLWPAMWVDPMGIFRQMLAETFGKVNEGHLVYFFGQPTLDPGPWFYSYVIPFRLTPLALIGSLLSLLFLIPKISSRTSYATNTHRFLSPLLLLWLFTLTLLIFGNLSPKKQDRYLLPLFPFLNILAAIGWVGLFELILYAIRRKKGVRSRAYGVRDKKYPSYALLLTPYFLLLITLHALPVITYYPYYLTYFNPLLGGPVRAAQTTLMGWGEGMEQVAEYLNTKPHAEKLYVASTPSQTLLPYFAGTGENFYTNDIALRADYVVLYLAQMQRLAPSPEIVRYFADQTPEETITIKGVTYANIYPGPKLILPDIPPEATPANIGLDNLIRLAGYRLPDRSESAPTSQLTLYWHALAPLPVDYTISFRVKAVDGRLLAQQDRWPVEGLLPSSQWRPGDYIVDTHRLSLPAGVDSSQIAFFEIVVYNADTGQTLGPSLIISNE